MTLRRRGPGRTVGYMGDVEVRGFRLFAGCLASKHGFGDGNVPDERLAAAMADPAVGRDGAHRGDRPVVEG